MIIAYKRVRDMSSWNWVSNSK